MKVYVKPGNIVRDMTIGHSEVAMHMRVAGTQMDVRIVPSAWGAAAQLLRPDGSDFSAAILMGEAGFYQDQNGFYFNTESAPEAYVESNRLKKPTKNEQRVLSSGEFEFLVGEFEGQVDRIMGGIGEASFAFDVDAQRFAQAVAAMGGNASVEPHHGSVSPSVKVAVEHRMQAGLIRNFMEAAARSKARQQGFAEVNVPQKGEIVIGPGGQGGIVVGPGTQPDTFLVQWGSGSMGPESIWNFHRTVGPEWMNAVNEPEMGIRGFAHWSIESLKHEQTVSGIHHALVTVFGSAFDMLPPDEMAILAEDAYALARDEGLEEIDAVHLLSDRIGGISNLRSYVDTLVAGALRRVRGESRKHEAFEVGDKAKFQGEPVEIVAVGVEGGEKVRVKFKDGHTGNVYPDALTEGLRHEGHNEWVRAMVGVGVKAEDAEEVAGGLPSPRDDLKYFASEVYYNLKDLGYPDEIADKAMTAVADTTYGESLKHEAYLSPDEIITKAVEVSRFSITREEAEALYVSSLPKIGGRHQAREKAKELGLDPMEDEIMDVLQFLGSKAKSKWEPDYESKQKHEYVSGGGDITGAPVRVLSVAWHAQEPYKDYVGKIGTIKWWDMGQDAYVVQFDDGWDGMFGAEQLEFVMGQQTSLSMDSLKHEQQSEEDLTAIFQDLNAIFGSGNWLLSSYNTPLGAGFHWKHRYADVYVKFHQDQTYEGVHVEVGTSYDVDTELLVGPGYNDVATVKEDINLLLKDQAQALKAGAASYKL